MSDRDVIPDLVWPRLEPLLPPGRRSVIPTMARSRVVADRDRGLRAVRRWDVLHQQPAR